MYMKLELNDLLKYFDVLSSEQSAHNKTDKKRVLKTHDKDQPDQPDQPDQQNVSNVGTTSSRTRRKKTLTAKSTKITEYIVAMRNKKYNFADYIAKKSIKKDAILALLDHIEHRDKYLRAFYKRSLDYKETELHFAANVTAMNTHNFDNNKFVQYKNIIRNMFFFEIMKNTKSGIDNNTPSFLEVLENLYLKKTIDYKLLTPSALHYIVNGRIASVFSSFYFRASIMNPYLVYSVNTALLNSSKKIFTPTLGWGSYLYGFAESGIDEYVGVDVIPNVCQRVKQFSAKYYPKIVTKIYCEPSEKLAKSRTFNRKYASHFDAVFFSPPYYDLELYESDHQSTTNYTTFEEWKTKYWIATIKMCEHVLKHGGFLCYIISNYGKHLDFVEQLNNAVLENTHLRFVNTQKMLNKNVNSTAHRITGEDIVLFVK